MQKVKLRLFNPLPPSVTFHETLGEAIMYFFKEFDEYFADKPKLREDIEEQGVEAYMDLFHVINIGAVWDIVERKKARRKGLRV